MLQVKCWCCRLSTNVAGWVLMLQVKCWCYRLSVDVAGKVLMLQVKCWCCRLSVVCCRLSVDVAGWVLMLQVKCCMLQVECCMLQVKCWCYRLSVDVAGWVYGPVAQWSGCPARPGSPAVPAPLWQGQCVPSNKSVGTHVLSASWFHKLFDLMIKKNDLYFCIKLMGNKD